MGAEALLDTRAKDLQALTLRLSPPAGRSGSSAGLSTSTCAPILCHDRESRLCRCGGQVAAL